MEQFAIYLFGFIRQLRAKDHILYQLNSYTSNSIGLSRKYQNLPCEVVQMDHIISAVSYTAACDLAC